VVVGMAADGPWSAWAHRRSGRGVEDGRHSLIVVTRHSNVVVRGQYGSKRPVTEKKERGLEHARKREGAMDQARMADCTSPGDFCSVPRISVQA
jgi:hypothetical protein